MTDTTREADDVEPPTDEVASSDQVQLRRGNRAEMGTAEGYLPPNWFTHYPRMNVDTLRVQLERLGERWDDEIYGDALHTYRRMARNRVWFRALGVFSGFALAGNFYFTFIYANQDQPHFSAADLVRVGKFLLAALIILGPGYVLTRFSVKFAYGRFFRLTGAVLKRLRAHELSRIDPRRISFRDYLVLPDGERLDLVGMVNDVGRAARSLFIALQSSRFTWKSPPLLADRALRLTHPLISLDIPDDVAQPGDDASRIRDTFQRFLNDVVGFVALGREDLIVRLRELYPELPIREEPGGGIPERDMLYLDPMRNRSRWDVVKDYVLPLAAWISLAVSITSLVISLRAR